MTIPTMTIPKTMRAMVTMGHGDFDVLQYKKDWPVPTLKADEVLVKVGACGLNNTDINTRTGWYSKAVTEATTGGAYSKIDDEDPTWGGARFYFPRIQGADVCGRVVAVGKDVAPTRIGDRVISDNWLRDADDLENKDKAGYFGSERDGGFAEYTSLPSRNALKIVSNFSDAELATFSCSYSTAEGMLSRTAVNESDTVLIPGASGGVGSALVQLAKLRGARVIAMAQEAKHAEVSALGADRVLPRSLENPKKTLSDENITVLADVVGGSAWPNLLDTLARGGRYVSSGAIAGPIVDLDLRTLYLMDLTLHGSTIIPLEVMPRLVQYIEDNKIKPVLAASFPLSELHKAQRQFIAKKHTGNIVVTP